MPADVSGAIDPSDEGEYYRKRCADLEAENSRLKTRVAELEAKLASLETTVRAVVARSIDAKADTERKRYKKSGRREGHQGASRARPARIDDTVELDQPFCPGCGGTLSEKLRRILRDAIRMADDADESNQRLRAKARFEARIDALIQEYSASREKNCLRLLKRLRREKGMLFTFLEEDGLDWNNNAAERALRSSVVIRKITYGNQSDEGAAVHAVLMSIRETCNLRKENFFDYAVGYLGGPTSER